jgi:MFS family permease
LPFLFLGACYLLVGVLCLFILPKIEDLRDDIEKKGMWKVLKIPGVLVCAIGISATSLSTGFVIAILEPHIRQFNLSNIIVGLFFICNSVSFAVSSPIWGYLNDKKFNLKLLAYSGAIFMLIGFLIVGPVSFLPFQPTVESVIIGLVFYGIGMGGILVTSFSDALQTGQILLKIYVNV